MRAVRFSMTSILPLIFMLLNTFDRGFAQQHPGIQAFVTPPEGCTIADLPNTKEILRNMNGFTEFVPCAAHSICASCSV